MALAFHPKQVDVETAGAVLHRAHPSRSILDAEKRLDEGTGVQTGGDFDHGVGEQVLVAQVGRLSLVDPACGNHSRLRQGIESGAGGLERGQTISHIAAQGDEGTTGRSDARACFQATQGLRTSAHVMDAHDAGACESRRTHHTSRCRIAGNCGVRPGDGTDEALARGGAQVRIAQVRHGRSGRLHGEVLVGVRAKARTWVDADGRGVDACLLKHMRLMQQVRLDLTRKARGVLARIGSRLACQVALAGMHGHNTATILSGNPHHLGVLEA